MIHRTQITDSTFDEISSSLHLEPEDRSFLPSFLIELSCRSMKHISGRAFSPREIPLLALSVGDDQAETVSLLPATDGEECTVISLVPSTSSTVAAVDVSSLRIGETETGVLIAIRGAIVWKANRGYQYLRCGPLTFHLGFGIGDGWSPDQSVFLTGRVFTERAISRLRNALERWIQRQICVSSDNAIVLFDGSLTAGTPDNPTAPLARILKSARERGSVVMAISKDTKLCAFGKRITSLVSATRAPCLLDVDRVVSKQFKSHPVRLAGHVYVAKLAGDGFAFRLDVDREVSQDASVAALNQLIASDGVMQGYPETLRLAHIFSTFTANEVIALQRFLALEHGLRIAHRFSVRKSLFGPFGDWEAA